MKQEIVILGGGFGGLYTYINLCKNIDPQKTHVTLINKTSHFLFSPLLHEVATGSLHKKQVVECLKDRIDPKHTTFLQDTILSLNTDNQTVTTKTKTLHYDILVVALGSESFHHSITGAKEFTLPLKTLNDAVEIKKQITSLLRNRASSKEDTPLYISVIGGGPTGVETIAEIDEFIDDLLTQDPFTKIPAKSLTLQLIHRGDSLITQFSPVLQKKARLGLQRDKVKILFNTEVAEVAKEHLHFKDGRTTPSHLTIWTAGVCAQKIPVDGSPFQLSQRGSIKVSSTLQVENFSNIFALGDIAQTPTKDPQLAQVATQQGLVVAENIQSLLNNKPLKDFVFRKKGMLLSLGRWNALGEIGPFLLSGKIGWFVWRTIYLANFSSWKKRLSIAFEWTRNIFHTRTP
jgi:NADH:ubiquinone reductase (H+-translocating)